MDSAALDPATFRAALESRGLRCTRQRMAVYDHLARCEHDHPSAEEAYQAVRRSIPTISLATVYKSLEALVECQLVTKLAAEDGTARYDARAENHYHLRDLRSGRVHDLATPFDPDLIAKLDPDLCRNLDSQGFRVTGYRLELMGYFADPEPET